MQTTYLRAAGLSAVAITAALVLGACGSDDSSSSGSGQNADACTQFSTTYDEFTALVKAGPADSDVEKWTAAKTAALGKFGPLADSASGSVKDAIVKLDGALPADSLELAEPNSESGQAFVDNSNAVASACGSDGTTITLDEFPLTKFTN